MALKKNKDFKKKGRMLTEYEKRQLYREKALNSKPPNCCVKYDVK